MILNYRINKENFKAIFCNDKESPDIFKAISKLYCDKKLLLIIDKKLSKKFTKYLFKDLKKCGLKVTLLKLLVQRLIKTKNYYSKL